MRCEWRDATFWGYQPGYVISPFNRSRSYTWQNTGCTLLNEVCTSRSSKLQRGHFKARGTNYLLSLQWRCPEVKQPVTASLQAKPKVQLPPAARYKRLKQRKHCLIYCLNMPPVFLLEPPNPLKPILLRKTSRTGLGRDAGWHREGSRIKTEGEKKKAK